MGYGYRLFKVQVAKGPSGYSPLLMDKVGDAKAQHYSEHVLDCLDLLEGWETLTGRPVLRGRTKQKLKEHRKDRGSKGDPRVRFTGHQVQADDSILFTVDYGRIGHYPKAMDVRKADDVSIGGLATGRSYRCLLMLPVVGKTGLLAIEDVDGGTPARVLPNWISRASDWRSRKVDKAQKPGSYRLVARQVKDLPRLRELIQNATDASIRLTKKTVSGSSKRKTTKIKVEYKLDTRKDREDALDWAEQFAGIGSGNLKGNGIVEMADIVDGSMKTVGFTDAIVVIKGDDGTKKVGAGLLDEVFVYSIADEERPSDDEWVQAVSSVVADMQTWLDVDLFDDETDEDES